MKKAVLKNFAILTGKHMHLINKNVPLQSGTKRLYGKENVPPKRDPGFMKVGSLLGGRVYFYINVFDSDFDFSIEFFYKVRSRLTEIPTLLGCFFSI